MDHESFNATIIDRVDIHEELAIIKIRPDAGHVPEFIPGQFATVGLNPEIEPMEGTEAAKEWAERDPEKRLPKMIRRAYSIASSPKTRDHIELFVVLVSEGKLTPRFWRVQKGGRIWMDERIRGEFSMEHVPDNQNLVMIGTGTGLAPFISMLRTYRGTGRWKKFVMIHGARYARDLGYRDELEQICREDPSVVYIPSCTREPAESKFDGFRGRVPLILEPETFGKLAGFDLSPSDTHLFLCGNPAMITDVQGKFEAVGYVTETKKNPGNIHFERYW